ncbi:MAG: hypothetical protein J6W10_06685, partial [Kiritimatiellae bacterium]|nr:hypothetical protein [Kiritimatiellia bacterium]
GTCAGCCLLMEPSKGHPDMLHMIPFRFGPSGGKAEMSIAFNDRAKELAGIRKGTQSITYAEGPVLVPSTPVADADVEVIGTYNSDINTKGGKARPSMAGKAAAVAGTYGKGRLFVTAVHPESDRADHFVLKGAFRYLTGREVEWDYPQRKRGQLAVGFMCDDSFGVETAKLVQKLLTEEEFDVIPLNKSRIAGGYLRRVDAVLTPEVVGTKTAAKGLYGTNTEKTKDFLSRGGRIFAWGNAAEALKAQGLGVTCVANADDAIELLRAFAAESVSPDAYKKLVLKKVEKPIRAGIFQNESNSNIPIARQLTLSPEYDLIVLGPEDYTNGVLETLDLVIQPGGGCTKQYKALGEKGAEALKKFVRGGGKYYGVCAGAFLAMQQSREGYPRLGLIPFKGDDPSHYRGDAPIKVAFTDEGMSALGTTNKTRTVIYFGGPAAVPGEPVADTDVKVLAKYSGRIINTKQPSPVEEMAGKGAFLGGPVGKGKIFVSCPHPEKDESTFDIVTGGIKFLTGVEPSAAPTLDRVRGAVSVRYRSSDKASAQYLFDVLTLDRRIDICPGKKLGDMEHLDVYVVTDEVKKGDVAQMEYFISRGGRVVIVADTPKEQKAAKMVKGAFTLDSYDGVVDAILK